MLNVSCCAGAARVVSCFVVAQVCPVLLVLHVLQHSAWNHQWRLGNSFNVQNQIHASAKSVYGMDGCRTESREQKAEEERQRGRERLVV
jgi:hypothetical protein